MCKNCKHPLFGRDLVTLSYHVAETSEKQQRLTLQNYIILIHVKIFYFCTCTNVQFCNVLLYHQSTKYFAVCPIHSYIPLTLGYLKKMLVFLYGTKRSTATFKKGHEYSSRIQKIFNSTGAAL
jgi:hypothetical protein